MSRNIVRGFICGDPALSLDKRPDTVTNIMLIIWGASPLAFLLICEISFNYDSLEKLQVCFKTSWKNVVYLSHRYLINMLMVNIICAAVKFFTGSHRPHFFETCQPDRNFNCTLGTFVSNYTCTNTNISKIWISDASMSFFSGHASTTVYSCFFIIWYLEKRLKSESLFLVPFIQTLLVCLSFFGAISRVFDHRHHWWDVLAGGILGLITTYHTCYVLCKNRYSPVEISQQLPTDVQNTFLDSSVKKTSIQVQIQEI